MLSSLAHTLHHLEVIALLIPFTALSLGLILGVFALAWFQPKGRR